jgi:uncharacterized membrane protein YjjB (DUF3815 family)
MDLPYEALEKAIWCGFAGLGFGILFNVPMRSLVVIWILAALGGIAKNLLVFAGIDLILASFIGASFIGFLSIVAAHQKHAPPLIFSIPALIPMVPGVFGFRTMLGLIQLSNSHAPENYSLVLYQTANNGIKTLLITMSLAVGASIPMLITRKTSAKDLKFSLRRKPT